MPPPSNTRQMRPQINFLAYISLKPYTYYSTLTSGVISSEIFSSSTICNGLILFEVFSYLFGGLDGLGLDGLPISLPNSSTTESSFVLYLTKGWLLACLVMTLSSTTSLLLWLSISFDTGIIMWLPFFFGSWAGITLPKGLVYITCSEGR